MAAIYSELFEGADGVTLTAANTTFEVVGFNASTGGRVFDTGLFKEGASSAEITTAAQTVFLTKDISATNKVYLRFYLRPDSSVGSGRPGANLVIAKFFTGAESQVAQLVYNTTGTLKIQGATSAIIGANTATALPVDQWSRIEVAVDGASSLLRVYPGTAKVDASGAPATAGDAQSGSHNHPNGASPAVNEVWVGALASSTVKFRLDAFQADDTTWVGPLATGGGGLAPTIDAGTDQVGVEPYTTVALGATSSETSVSWSQLTGTAVTLSGSGLSRTFTAPGTLAGETLTFRASATNVNGTTTDDVAVTVLQANERLAVGASWVPMQVTTL